MKKFLLLSLVFLFIFSACNSDDNNSDIDPRILGLWVLETNTTNAKADMDDTEKEYLEFKSDGTLLESEYYKSGDISGCNINPRTYTFDGTTLDEKGYKSTVTFNENKMTIALNNGGGVLSYVFVKADESEFNELFIKQKDESLYGEWMLITVDGNDVSKNGCEGKTILTVNNNGTYSLNAFITEEDTCIADNDQGTWETYQLCKILLTDSNFDGKRRLEYSVVGNTLQIIREDTDETILVFTRKLML